MRPAGRPRIPAERIIMTDTFRPRNLRIFSYRTNKIMMHIEDLLDLGKIGISLWQYSKGNGSSKHFTCYVDATDARLIAHQILIGKLQPWTDYKGNANQKTGEIIARVLRVEQATDTKIKGLRINCAAGSGTKLPTGAVKPAGKLDSLTALIPTEEAMKMALAIREHLQAWATATYYARKDECWKPEETQD